MHSLSVHSGVNKHATAFYDAGINAYSSNAIPMHSCSLPIASTSTEDPSCPADEKPKLYIITEG